MPDPHQATQGLIELQLVSWNVAARTRFTEKQVAELLEMDPDVICLQEVSRKAQSVWKECLAEHGFQTRFNIDKDRTRGVALASRLKMAEARTPELPRSDAIVGACCGGVPVWCVHMPNGANNGAVKPKCFELLAEAASDHLRPLVIAGDFNGPQAEHPDGTILTWGQTNKGSQRARHGLPKGAWDAAERAVFEGLPAAGLRDVFRDHRNQFDDPTWRGYRLDHVFTDLECRSVRHVSGTSDHKMVVAKLNA